MFQVSCLMTRPNGSSWRTVAGFWLSENPSSDLTPLFAKKTIAHRQNFKEMLFGREGPGVSPLGVWLLATLKCRWPLAISHWRVVNA
jgi:hypothetical protein